LLALMNDLNLEPRVLVRIIEQDPVIARQMIKRVNSAYFGLSRRIASVKEAVAFIGINTLKHLAISIAGVNSGTARARVSARR
jgi:HD-like signal output (HDOD) protein